MVIISKTQINIFVKLHADSEEALMKWYVITKEADWHDFSAMKRSFGSVDNDLYVFNIKGNRYRLIARIIFGVRTIYIKFIGSHAEYDKVDLAKL